MPVLVVAGKVVTSLGEPLAGLIAIVQVKAAVDAISTATSATTASDGTYGANVAVTTDTADIMVIILDTGVEVGRSALVFGAAGTVRIDVVVGTTAYRGRSEYRRIEASIDVLRGGVAVKDLAAQHIEYLAGKLQVHPMRIAEYIHAARLAALTGAAVPPALYYALLRQGFPKGLHELAAQGPQAHARAFAAAIANNTINDPGQTVRDAAIVALEGVAASTAVWSDPAGPTKSKFRALLDTASGPEASGAKQLLFMEKYLAYEGTTAEFWDDVEATPALGATVRATYEWSLQIHTLANGHAPLIEALQALHEQAVEPIASFADLAAFDVQDWIDLLSDDQAGPAIGAPPEIPTTWPEADRIQRYAETLERIIADTYPTRVIRERIARDHNEDPTDIPGAADLIQFFRDNPGFELLDHELTAYLAANPTALANVTEPGSTQRNLAKLQRLMHVAPRGRHYPVVKTLYKAGVTSATAIDMMGERSFLRKHAAAVGGVDVAKSVYDNAAQVAALTTALVTQYSAGFNKTPFTFLDKQAKGFPPENADLEALFGNLDFCACEHCRSVYSPAAYFVDLLHFLENQPGKNATDSALDALTVRRPNLPHIELSCINTNTELPYIDLVNELLEYHVAGYAANPTLPGNEFWQTTWEASELALRPEHQLAAAYQLTAAAPYPFSLPFNLPFAETTLYHESLGVSRERMLLALPIFGDDGWSDRRARAVLGLDLKTWRIIIASNVLTEAPEAFWSASGANWWVPLRAVSTLLARANLELPELVTLLRTRFIGRVGLSIAYADPPNDCNLDLAKLNALNAADLGKIHRFLRLQRKLGWSAYELDAALFHLGGSGGLLDDLMVRKLAALHRLTTRLQLSVLTALPLWSSIDRFTPPEDPKLRNFYELRFLSRVIDDPGAVNFALNGTKTELSNIGESIAHSSRIATVQAALGISSEQVQVLFDWLGEPDETTLEVLVRAYRRTTLARALGVSLGELRRLIDLIDFSPFHEAGTVPDEGAMLSTEWFLDAVDIVRASPFSSEELAYLLQHTTPQTPGVAPDPDVRFRFIEGLTQSLYELQEKYTLAEEALGEDPLGQRVHDALAEILLPDNLEPAMAIVHGTSLEPVEQQEARLNAHLNPSGNIVPFFSNLADAKAKLVSGGLTDRARRYEYVLRQLYPQLARRAKNDRVVQQFAQHFALPAETMLVLLRDHLAQGGSPLLLVFEALQLIYNGALTDVARYAYERIHKSARLVSKFGFVASELHYLYGQGFGTWLDVADLPSGEEPVTPATFAAWRALYDVTRARALFPRHPTTLADLRAAATIEDVRAILAERAEWTTADVEAAALHFSLANPSDIDTLGPLLLIADAIAVARQLLTPVSIALLWAAGEPDEPVTKQPENMRKALRGRHDESTWRSVGQSIQDALRVRQRDALVAYLVWKRADINSADDLYKNLLVDVEMSACQKTSRIRFALSSVQQFIQRVFLGLEAGLVFDEEAEAEWRWMKLYRLWEANRKVFLYPENWIDPTLRDDKSVFFAELEEALLQGDVTKQSAEDAYVAYLEKLRQVARPEVVGMYREHEKVGSNSYVDQLHVVARTPDSPHRYFYRRREGKVWTPWEPLLGDISGRHIMPIVYGGRLYVFWIEFRTENDMNNEERTQSHETPRVRLVAQLFWVERRGKSWSARYRAEDCSLFLDSQKPDDPSNPDNDSMFNDVDDPYYVLERRYRSAARVIDGSLYISVRGIDNSTDPTDDFSSYTSTLTSRGFFVLSTKTGRFVTQKGGGTIKSIQPGRIAFGQEWASLTSNSAHFWVHAPDSEDKKRVATLFSHVGHPYSAMFEHLNHHCKVDDAGFFLKMRDHRFYVETRARGGMIQDGEHDKGKHSTLNSPSVAKSDAFAWREYAGLPAVASEPEGAVGGGVARRYLSDGLAVPMKWSGSVPGSGVAASRAMTFSGQSEAALQETQALVEGLLGAPPTQQSQTMPGKWFDQLFHVHLFQHSYIGNFLGYIRRFQVEGLLRPLKSLDQSNLTRQRATGNLLDDPQYVPGPDLKQEELLNDIDFEYDGAYSVYNWELFFHAPLLVSDQLSRQGRFEEAEAWLRTIFDPTTSDGSGVERFWKIKPFHENADIPSIQELLLALDGQGPSAKLRLRMEHQVAAWRKDPFNPHLIARLRNGTYQRATVMRYLDNLIAWGDARFAQDTVESLNEATQVYMLAKAILGDRPHEVKKPNTAAPKTYATLGDLDAFSNALVELQGKMNGSQLGMTITLGNAAGSSQSNDKAKPPKFWYFCVPPNAQLLAYWDVVDDRLYKIRHCQDIHGVVRRLSLFDAPLDPGQLVKAAAAGVDLASALTQLTGRAPIYRFQTLLGKAYELANEVKALGSGILAAVEKKEAEDLALLRTQHERSVLRLSRQVREAQIAEADESLKSAQAALPIVQARRNYYQGLLDSGWSASEQTQVNTQQIAMDATLAATAANLLGTELGMFPNFDFGTEGGASSPVVKAQFGGQQLSAVAGMVAGLYQGESSYNSMSSGLAGVNASYERRAQDWQQQVAVADLELVQVNQQIVAAEARKVISERELRSHDLQIEHAEMVETFMRSKYSRSELYSWMIGKLSVLYKKAYELAYRAAVAAQQAYQYELHSTESFLGFSYWDQGQSGMLAGEHLALDLRRMDAEFLDNHRREYELTKRISLAQLDPYALTQLRETGSCYVHVPEHVFDLDHPGHFLRRIRMASIALPGVTGPHVNVGCTLTLESSKIRVVPSAAGGYPENGTDLRFSYRYGKVEQIVTSSGQDSTGLFEPSLNDPRYLPFEGAGVISTWRIELPGNYRQFDYRSIADVVLTLQYTAREGGSGLRAAALASVPTAMSAYENAATDPGAAVVFRASVDFSAAWNAFLYSEVPVADRTLELDLGATRFPYLAAKAPGLKITAVRGVLIAATNVEVLGVVLKREATPIGQAGSLTSDGVVLAGAPTRLWTVGTLDPGDWSIEVAASTLPDAYKQSYEIDNLDYYRFKDGVVRDMLIIVHYSI